SPRNFLLTPLAPPALSPPGNPAARMATPHGRIVPPGRSRSHPQLRRLPLFCRHRGPASHPALRLARRLATVLRRVSTPRLVHRPLLVWGAARTVPRRAERLAL